MPRKVGMLFSGTVAAQNLLDPVHFGTLVVLNLSIGLATPPVGVCLFVACAIGDTTLSKVIPVLVPYLIACIIVLILITYIPEISTFIPHSIMGS